MADIELGKSAGGNGQDEAGKAVDVQSKVSRLGWRDALKKQASIEWDIFMANRTWAWCLMGLMNQYFHSVWTNLVFYFYEVRPALRDLGFEMLPTIGEDYFWVSESVFYPLFIFGIASVFWPLVLCFTSKRPPFRPHNIVILLKRLAIHLTICQTLRALSFMFTILPGPADHCQSETNENFDQPTTVWDVLFRMDASYGCGDLIFSSHTAFTLTFCLVITRYLPYRELIIFVWSVQAVLIFLIIASHKHYTVDLIVALYTVPMVWTLLQYKMPDPPAVMFYHTNRDGPSKSGTDSVVTPTTALVDSDACGEKPVESDEEDTKN